VAKEKDLPRHGAEPRGEGDEQDVAHARALVIPIRATCSGEVGPHAVRKHISGEHIWCNCARIPGRQRRALRPWLPGSTLSAVIEAAQDAFGANPSIAAAVQHAGGINVFFPPEGAGWPREPTGPWGDRPLPANKVGMTQGSSIIVRPRDVTLEGAATILHELAHEVWFQWATSGQGTRDTANFARLVLTRSGGSARLIVLTYWSKPYIASLRQLGNTIDATIGTGEWVGGGD
jgi:hypothetical protein